MIVQRLLSPLNGNCTCERVSARSSAVPNEIAKFVIDQMNHSRVKTSVLRLLFKTHWPHLTLFRQFVFLYNFSRVDFVPLLYFFWPRFSILFTPFFIYRRIESWRENAKNQRRKKKSRNQNERKNIVFVPNVICTFWK